MDCNEKTKSDSWSDPYISPDIQPIPACSVCQDKYKADGYPDYFMV